MSNDYLSDLDDYIAAIDRGDCDLNELARPLRTAICRRAGWQDSIIRTSRSQEPNRRTAFNLARAEKNVRDNTARAEKALGTIFANSRGL